MSTLIDIAAAIQELSEADMRELSTWLQNVLDERWDRQLESDVAEGKLDQLIANAEADINKGHVRKLRTYDLYA